MPRWNKALWLALGSFWAMVIYSGEQREWLGDAAPLPPPGLTSGFKFRPADNWKRYGLAGEFYVVPLPATTSNGPPPDCTFVATYRNFEGGTQTQRIRFRHTGDLQRPSTARLSPDPLKFSPGYYEVTVRNLGCEREFAFIGGTLHMGRYSPVMFSGSTLPLLGAGALALLGLLATIAGAIALRRSRPKTA
jgi:hypothetical protein